MSSTFLEPLTHGDTVRGEGQKDMLTAERESSESTSATAPWIQFPGTRSIPAHYSQPMSKVGRANPQGRPRQTLPGSGQGYRRRSSGRNREMVSKGDNEHESKQHLDGSTEDARPPRKGKFLDIMRNCRY